MNLILGKAKQINKNKTFVTKSKTLYTKFKAFKALIWDYQI